MKTDYNKLFKQQLAVLKGKPRLLLHCCCAPCSSGVIERLKPYFDITYLYYNPNIYPKQEYDLRKQQFEKLDISVVDLGYNHSEYLNAVAGLESEREGGARCKKCIALRMQKAFEYASQHGFDFVTTTLSISPHKDAEFINKTGEQLQKDFKIAYLYADFKKDNGFLTTTLVCKQKGIYRQKYCGCEFAKPNTD